MALFKNWPKTQGGVASLLPLLNSFGIGGDSREAEEKSDLLNLILGAKQRPSATPPSVGINLPPMSTSRPPTRTRISAKPSGSFFSNLPTSPSGSISDLLGGMGGSTTGPSPEEVLSDLFGGGVQEDPQAPPSTPLSTDRVEGELGDLLSGGVQEYFPSGPFVGTPPGTGTGAQPPPKVQRIQQLMAQVRALKDQIRQIKRQIQELQGGGRPPKDIGFTPLPQPPWTPPPGG